MRDCFDLTPEQYHAGIDKLWDVLGNPPATDDDVFTRVVAEIERLRAEIKSLTDIARFSLGDDAKDTNDPVFKLGLMYVQAKWRVKLELDGRTAKEPSIHIGVSPGIIPFDE
jgi:hypothetical protein